MENHWNMTDLELKKQFAEGTLEPRLFNHEAHVRLAWIHLTHYGIDKAIENIRIQLKHFVAVAGAAGKYNETVTVAAVRAVHHFMRKSEANNFKDFIDENQRLKSQFKALLSAHYRTNIFISEKAKKEYLEPELLPFD